MCIENKAIHPTVGFIDATEAAVEANLGESEFAYNIGTIRKALT